MFDFVYYPVSFILWCWHWVFARVLGDANAIGWALAIVFLVFTLRLIMLKPTISQVRSMRKMQQFAPEMKKIQKKYANDRQRQAMEMQRLQREHGVNPLGGCLPLILQVPVFIALNHVLRSFQPTSPRNYFFGPHDVQSYLSADLFGAHLGDAILGVSNWGGSPGWHWAVAPVAIPLMIVASVATHFTARLSVERQLAMGTPVTGQTAMMNKITMYVFPLGVLVFGGGLPIGLLLYWLSNNVWTLGQQHFVFQRMDREEEEKKAQAIEQRQALAPKPGQKPTQPKNKRASAGTGTKAPTKVDAPTESSTAESSTASEKPEAEAAKRRSGAAGTSVGGKAKVAANGDGRGSSPAPGLVADRARRKKQDRKRG